MAIIDVTHRSYVSKSIYVTLDKRTFLVRVPTISIMTDDELTIKGLPVNSFDDNIIHIDDVKDKYTKRKKKNIKRDTSDDTIIIGTDGNMLGSASDSMLTGILTNRKTKHIKTKSEKMMEHTTELYLNISSMIDVSKNGYGIKLLNVEDVIIINTIINETLDKIENSINVRNHALVESLNTFLEHMVSLNKVKLSRDVVKDDSKIMNDVFGVDIFMTSPSPTKQYDMKDIKVM